MASYDLDECLRLNTSEFHPSEDPEYVFSIRLTIRIRSFDDASDLLFLVIVLKKTLETFIS